MNYSDPLISQVTVFFRSVGAGIILGIIYSALSFLRMVFGEKKSVYITFDIIFAVTASVVSFFFMVLYNTGQVRFNLMVGELAGGLAFHLSIGRYFLSVMQKYINAIRKTVAFLLSPIKKIADKTAVKIRALLKNHKKADSQEKNTEKIKKKFINIRKIPLKNKNKSV